MAPGRRVASKANSSNNGDPKAPQKRESSRASSPNNGDPKAPQKREPSRASSSKNGEPKAPQKREPSRASSPNNGDPKAPQKPEPSRASSSNNGDPRAPQKRLPSRSRNVAKSDPLSTFESPRMSRLQPAPIPRINPWLQGLKLSAKVEPSQPIPAHLEEESPLPSASRKRNRPATSKKSEEGGASGSPEGTINVPECPDAPRSKSKSPTNALRHQSRSPTLSQNRTAEPVSLEETDKSECPDAPRSKSKSPTNALRHRSRSPTLSQTTTAEPVFLGETSKSTRSPSTSSEASRSALIAAASRAESNLFENPVGSDVLVCAGTWSWRVHRNILVRESDWFKDNLPELEKDEDLIKVTFDCAPETLGYCIRYMYTQKIEELLEPKPCDVSHLPRCVLSYCAAVYFRTKGMISLILRIVEVTAKDIYEGLSKRHQKSNGVSTRALASNEYHLLDALDLLYSQENQAIMEPMRIAMVAVLDETLFFHIHRGAFMETLRAYPWIPDIQADFAEFRRQIGFRRQGSLIPSGEALDTMLSHPDLKHTASIEI